MFIKKINFTNKYDVCKNDIDKNTDNKNNLISTKQSNNAQFTGDLVLLKKPLSSRAKKYLGNIIHRLNNGFQFNLTRKKYDVFFTYTDTAGEYLLSIYNKLNDYEKFTDIIIIDGEQPGIKSVIINTTASKNEEIVIIKTKKMLREINKQIKVNLRKLLHTKQEKHIEKENMIKTERVLNLVKNKASTDIKKSNNDFDL